MVKLLFLVNGKTGGFFVVEGTPSQVITAGFLKGNPSIDQVDDVDPRHQIVDECLRNPSGHTLFDTPKPVALKD
jgi:hypothetical protein